MDKELLELLKARGIPLEAWGKGEAKSFDHLVAEIASGETTLLDEDEKIFRKAEGASINVYHDDGAHVWLLKEDRQVFKDGRSRTRDPGASIGEKLRPGETPIDAAKRALQEELGIEEDVPLIAKSSFTKGPLPSSSYPGTFSLYRVNMFDAFLPTHLFKKEGYIEHQKDKDSYFVWVKHSNSNARA